MTFVLQVGSLCLNEQLWLPVLTLNDPIHQSFSVILSVQDFEHLTQNTLRFSDFVFCFCNGDHPVSLRHFQGAVGFF